MIAHSARFSAGQRAARTGVGNESRPWNICLYYMYCEIQFTYHVYIDNTLTINMFLNMLKLQEVSLTGIPHIYNFITHSFPCCFDRHCMTNNSQLSVICICINIISHNPFVISHNAIASFISHLDLGKRVSQIKVRKHLNNDIQVRPLAWLVLSASHLIKSVTKSSHRVHPGNLS